MISHQPEMLFVVRLPVSQSMPVTPSRRSCRPASAKSIPPVPRTQAPCFASTRHFLPSPHPDPRHTFATCWPSAAGELLAPAPKARTGFITFLIAAIHHFDPSISTLVSSFSMSIPYHSLVLNSSRPIVHNNVSISDQAPYVGFDWRIPDLKVICFTLRLRAREA